MQIELSNENQSNITILRNEVKSVNDTFAAVTGYNQVCIDGYLYKSDTYINSSGDEASLTGYDTYKIPVLPGDMVLIKQINGDAVFYGDLNVNDVYHIINNNEYDSNFLIVKMEDLME